MNGASEPGRPEVLGWMARLGRGASDAADHFWPGAEGADRTRIVARIRKWAQLARERGEPDAPPIGPGNPAPAGNREQEAEVVRPPPDLETARLPRVELLERQLAELLADVAYVRAAGLVGRPGLVGPMTAQILDVIDRLDQARQDSGRAVTLERSPAAVADEMARRDRRIRELMARAAEREL